MYLGKNIDELKQAKAFHTAKEICQQGKVWRKLALLVENIDTDLVKTLEKITYDKNAQIILTGAGTSAYIGNILALALDNICAAQVRSIPTTDIVSQPGSYFTDKSKGVVISFGRSGSSPESIDAVEKIEQIAPNMHHIYVTCNKNGGLAQRVEQNKRAYLCLMPEETHDVSFVMSSSFSSMLLFTYGLFVKTILGETDFDYTTLALQSDEIAHNFYHNRLFEKIEQIERIVYLGSNNLYGAAQESALKAVEMTTGQIITMAETSLGFRHGPKSIVNDKTLICVFVSNDPYTQLFDKDIINELAQDDDMLQIVVFANEAFFAEYPLSQDNIIRVALRKELTHYNDALMGAIFVNFAQIIGFNIATYLGFSPDDPCPTGQVNRVVQGVTIYDYPKK
ncbi:MAG: sugar isomerase [Alphaproteobacteria bacterium]